MKRRRRRKYQRLIVNLILIFIVVLVVSPFIWTVNISLKYPRDILTAKIISEPTLLNYKEVFGEGSKFSSYFLNSITVAILTTILGLGVGLLAAYCLSRWKFRWDFGKYVLTFLLFARMIFPVALAIPYYTIVRKFGLHDTIIALVLIHTATNIPFAVLLLKTFFDDFPISIEEAAKIDGCSVFGVLFKVVFPLSGPSIAATSILLFIFSWNEYLFASILTVSPEAMTVPIGLAGYVQENIILWGPMSAAATVFSVPVFIFTFLVQDHLIKGFTLGTFKG